MSEFKILKDNNYRLFSNTVTEEVYKYIRIAVLYAEKDLKKQSGKAKLRFVYKITVKKFPQIQSTISFDTFSEIVSAIVSWMNIMLNNGVNLEDIQNSVLEAK